MRIPLPIIHRDEDKSSHGPSYNNNGSGPDQKPMVVPNAHGADASGGYAPNYQQPPPEWPSVKLRLEVLDLKHPGAKLFFEHLNPSEALAEAVQNVFKWLYKVETCPRQ